MLKKLPLIFCLMFVSALAFAQVASERPGRKNDSINQPYTYNYIFPILGQAAASKGFKVPFPHGVMFNFLPMRQNIQLSGMHVGFNGGELINIDEIVVFNPTEITGYTANLRFDTWILPFLNVYGMYGALHSNTKVSLQNPIDLTVNVPIDGSYGSLGIMAAGGFKNLFFSGDFSHSWTFNDKLEEPARVVLAGFRMGPIFRIKDKPEMNIVVWGGAMYSHLISQTNGSISATEVFPDLENNVSQIKGDLQSWYDELPPLKQQLYKPIYDKLNNGFDDLIAFGEDGTIQYEMQKSIERPYNIVIGGQWQINYRWQFRVEGQFLGDRQAGLLSLNYRFGIPGKNLFAK